MPSIIKSSKNCLNKIILLINFHFIKPAIKNLKEKSYLFLFLIFSIDSSFAAEVKYPVSEIPPEMIKEAQVVIREYQTEIKIISKGEAVKKVKKVITILNDKGREGGFLGIGYDRFIKVNYIKGNIYDSSGKLIYKLKTLDIEDVSAISNISIYDDNRIKIFKTKIYNYPYTIEYEYELNTRGLLTFSSWYPVLSTETSLIKGSFKVITPKDFMIRHKERNNIAKPEISADAHANNIYLWKVNNLPVITLEDHGPDPYELLPQVMIGAYEFEMEGYSGNFNS
jgi:hypothetical protein